MEYKKCEKNLGASLCFQSSIQNHGSCTTYIHVEFRHFGPQQSELYTDNKKQFYMSAKCDMVPINVAASNLGIINDVLLWFSVIYNII